MTIEVTKQIKLVKWIKGKEYSIIVDIENDGTMRFNLSKHPGSKQQLEGILTSIADTFGTIFETEKHINNENLHIYDDNLGIETVSSGENP